jgi:hypothetical protein
MTLLICLLIVAVLLCSRIGRVLLMLSIVSIGGLWLFFGN